MKIGLFLETVREETVIKVFSRFVTLITNLYELLASDTPGDDFKAILGELKVQVDTISQRLGRMEVPDDLWRSVAPNVASAHVDSWPELKALLTRRILPEISASIDLILRTAPGREADNALKVLRTRVTSAQEMFTGMAPIGQAAAAAVDEQPDGIPPKIQESLYAETSIGAAGHPDHAAVAKVLTDRALMMLGDLVDDIKKRGSKSLADVPKPFLQGFLKLYTNPDERMYFEINGKKIFAMLRFDFLVRKQNNIILGAEVVDEDKPLKWIDHPGVIVILKVNASSDLSEGITEYVENKIRSFMSHEATHIIQMYYSKVPVGYVSSGDFHNYVNQPIERQAWTTSVIEDLKVYLKSKPEKPSFELAMKSSGSWKLLKTELEKKGTGTLNDVKRRLAAWWQDNTK